MSSVTLFVIASMTFAAVEAGPQDAVAVLDIQGTGVSPELLPTLTEILTVEIAELGTYKVIAGRDIQSMLGFEQQKEVIGCTDAACLAEIGGALGVGRIVASHIGKVGSTYVINIKLINIRQADTEGRVYETVRGEVDELIETMRRSVRKLLGDGPRVSRTRPAEPAGPSATRHTRPAPVVPPPVEERRPKAAAVVESPAQGAHEARGGTGRSIGVMPWVLWGAGAAALGGGAFAGVSAKSQEKAANDQSRPGSQLAAQRAKDRARLANVLLGVGVLAASGGFAWMLIAGGEDATALVPVVSPDGWALVVSGGF